LKKRNDILQSTGYRKTTIEGILSEKQIVGGMSSIQVIFPKTVSHCYLIEIGQQGQGSQVGALDYIIHCVTRL
jgi:hypothetical protein